ncbi:uncharacterized protein KY384_007198 [Bacidia gigantensis]|uniref:uncharacterized protein n=1 Tax=Bacidia gigantensis TaxID=2732470 RepID=UPI001D04167F|nr:uncharacterized protein KY384_007198 [Bacidia gigantensis]KAG8528281.1 hypothetical protein KY384_007198 [Bacidia gigantensis]
MPRRAFIADLQQISKEDLGSNVSNIKAGEDDGQVSFIYMHRGSPTEVIALVPDLGDYPESHSYMFFTKSDQVDPSIQEAVHSMPDYSTMRISDMLTKVIKSLDKATGNPKDSTIDRMAVDSDSGDELEDEESPQEYDSDDEAWSTKPANARSSTSGKGYFRANEDQKTQKARLRHDLRLAKEAGFRVSVVGSLVHGGRDGVVELSIRVAKLGISEEALDAWNMHPSQYLVLLIRYLSGYQCFEELTGSRPSNMQIRVGLCAKYKVGMDEALGAFVRLDEKDKDKYQGKNPDHKSATGSALERIFIERPLEELLNERLLLLLQYRLALGLPWIGAEEFLNDHQGRNLESNAPDPKYWKEESLKPSIATHDHLRDLDRQKSFPLISMQYALRHLVRCTEFCLVCHCKVEEDFEALKPYVCSKPLCLYQYMSLGFGPSIEHEILTQPHVVDLLISFCYASAHCRKLRYLPTGMALTVPTLSTLDYTKIVTNKTTYNSYLTAKFDRQKLELLFPPGSKVPLQVGSWITMVALDGSSNKWHCRVIESTPPVVRLGELVTPLKVSFNSTASGYTSTPDRPSTPQPNVKESTPPVTAEEAFRSSYQDIGFYIYNKNFDDLVSEEKYATICMLLDTLPSLPEMHKYLLSRGSQELSLRHWADRISPASLGLLRWIIASNRSCIVQVDNLEGTTRKSEARVSGMPGWMQFRFAQGAPDKEQRFITSIRETTPTATHPTRFAWHGSPLYNWHGIVREGLHFNEISHGRAYGNGVYHAMDVHTSCGYSGHHLHPNVYQGGPYKWPPSQLNVSSAVALNEIVNAPQQFVSSQPYLVVAQLDWIQSRYLFVKCNVDGWQIPDTEPSEIYSLDPMATPRGQNGTPLVLPLNAVSKARRPTTAPKTPKSVKTGIKKAKLNQANPAEEAVIDISDDTDVEDLAIFLSDIEEIPQPTTTKGKTPAKSAKKPLHDPEKMTFAPGTLDIKSLVLLEPPSYATSMATKALQRELQATLKVQDSHPIHELGWYINSELISNVYQWIVELHSFENKLPLAQDMKKQDVQSVVLEVRFGAQYPMSPPFVRVIRPRFLGFQQGGGGHITMGGALCMELLTNSGWSAVSSIESVLLQVRLAVESIDPKPARLSGARGDYGVGEAVEAYIRAATAHGWEVPRDFKSSYMGGETSRNNVPI